MDSEEWLDQVEALSVTASPGPWSYGGQGWVFASGRVPGAGPGEMDDLAASVSNDEDALFIAAARTDLPATITALRSVLDLGPHLIKSNPGEHIEYVRREDIRIAIATALGVTE